MNYLAHQYVARRFRPERDTPALFFAGNLLPDLLAASGDGRLRDVAGRTGSLAEGVKLHLETDKVFHGLTAFHKVQTEANRLLLAATWEAPPRRRFFLAHVMTELSLDAQLLHNHPSLPDDLYAALSESLTGDLIAQTEHIMERPVANLRPSVERFLESRFFYQYATPSGLASSLMRVSQRAGVPNFADERDQVTLGRIFDTFSVTVSACAADLLHFPVADSGIHS